MRYHHRRWRPGWLVLRSYPSSDRHQCFDVGGGRRYYAKPTSPDVSVRSRATTLSSVQLLTHQLESGIFPSFYMSLTKQVSWMKPYWPVTKKRGGLTFRTPFGGSHEILAEIPLGKNITAYSVIDYGDQLGQPRLAVIIRERARQLSNFTIRFGTRNDSLYESADSVRVLTSTTQGTSE